MHAPQVVDEIPSSRWLSWTDRAIPRSLLEDPGTRLRARVTVAIAVFTTVASPAVEALRLSMQPQHWFAVTSWAVCTALFAAIPWVMRLTGSLKVAGAMPSIAATIGSIGVAVPEGGLTSPNAFVILTAPVVTTFLAGRRAGVWVTAFVIAILTVLFGAHALGLVSATSPLHPTALVTMRWLLHGIVTVGLLVVVHLYDQERAHAQQALELKAKELERARDAALDAARTKSAFLANMSHEMRTPLTSVIGMTELMLSSEDGATDRRDLEVVRKSGQALLSVINDVLDFSKIEANQVSIEAKPFNLRSCVHDVLSMVWHAAREKKLQLLVDDSQCPEYVLGDSLRVQQVLTNLLGNAIKFTERGYVRLHARRLDTTVVELAVEDTGIGIPEAVAAQLFQPFAQADVSTTRKYGGSGLGLAISRRLATLMGGGIELSSAEGSGSTFAFTFSAPDAPHTAPSDTGVHPSSRPAGIRETPIRVLLAEDNPVNARIFVAMLKKLGQAATVVEDGERALATLRREKFDVAFLDVQMPGLDGLEVARRLLASAPANRPHLVAFTASVLSDQRQNYADAGFDDLLAKPVEVADVEAVLARAMRARRKLMKRCG